MKLKLPKIKIPTIITRRESNGAVEIFGMTGGELAISTGAVCGLYVFLAGFFTILLVISQAIRNNGDFVRFSLHIISKFITSSFFFFFTLSTN